MKYFYTLLLSVSLSPLFGQHVISTTVYFDYDKATPSESALKSLTPFLDSIRILRVTSVMIEGHTDKAGSNAYNVQLSKERMETVWKIVQKHLKSGVPVSNSFRGEEQLVTAADEQQAVNRRVVITVTWEDEPIKPAEKLEPFFEDVEAQRFSVNLEDTIYIQAKEGTAIRILPGSIQTIAGKTAKGKAEILIKEYFQPGDIVLSGLNTMSKQGLLQTGGMLRLVVVKDGDTMATKTKKPVEMKLPAAADAFGNMNVYTLNNSPDWNKTNDVFIWTSGVWQWPKKLGQLENLVVPDIRFENWRTGYTYTDEYNAWESNWRFLDIPIGNRSEIDRVTNTIVKIDSVTLRASIRAFYRKRGIKKYGSKHFDSSFLVKYKRAEYIAMPSTINWINCDRFLNYTDKINFYVNTPDFEGANVVVYFRSLRAFMQAGSEGNSKYKISKVPSGEKVWLIAFGRKNGEYYIAKKEFTTSKGSTASLELDKVPEAEFRKVLKRL